MKNIIRYMIFIMLSLACSNGINDMSDRMQSTAEPEISPASGTYASDISVTISCTTSGAIIYYTTNGSTPTASSSVYVTPVSVAGDGTSMTIRAMAAKTGMVDSTTAQTSYVIKFPSVPSPSVSPANHQVTLTWTMDPGASSYNLYWSKTPGVTKATGNKITGVTSPYVHSSLTNWTNYYYIMTSVNPAGSESLASPEIKIMPGLMAVYVTNNGGGISAYTITADNGIPIPVVGSPFLDNENPGSIGVEPLMQYAYATNWKAPGTVSCFKIDPINGALSLISTLGGTTTASSVTFDQNGNYAFVSCYSSNVVEICSIDRVTGSLTYISSVTTGGQGLFSAKANTLGTLLYVANNTESTIAGFKIAGSTLTSTGTAVADGTNLGPICLAIDPTNKYLYVANNGGNNINAYTISTSPTAGLLNLISGFPIAAGTNPNSIAIDPNGKYLYVANWNSNDVSAYTIGSGGVLTAMAGSPFTAGTHPSSVTVDPLGKYVYVANYGGGLSVYTITTTGALSPIPGTFITETQPNWVTVTKLP